MTSQYESYCGLGIQQQRWELYYTKHKGRPVFFTTGFRSYDEMIILVSTLGEKVAQSVRTWCRLQVLSMSPLYLASVGSNHHRSHPAAIG